ncbi:hypothetical protein Dimus_008771 [Dionaea muscipula]
MANPDQEAIDTFISITGSSDVIARQRIEEHGGNLNEAIDAYFNEGDRNFIQEAPQNDFMDIDDPMEPQPGVAPSLLSATGVLNPFSLLDANFRRSVFDTRNFLDTSPNFLNRTPYVSHPREVRQIPIEFKDETASSGPSGYGPKIVDVTDTEHAQAPEIRGRVIIDDDDDDDEEDNIPNAAAQNLGRGGQGVRASHTHSRPSVPELDSMHDYENDIEEEMIRAAIEASKKDAKLQKHQALNQDEAQQGQEHFEDEELEHVVSISLKTAERERKLREQTVKVGASGTSGSKPVYVEELSQTAESSERASTRLENETRSAFVVDEVEELNEQPLITRRSGPTLSSSTEAREVVDATKISLPPSPQHATASHPQPNGNVFPSDEWGGISSEEHDEAVMLEAAMFGGIPDGSSYPFPYGPQPFIRSVLDRTRQAPRPPSPGLTAQRLIREQQDDEYLASLQADREKELKAIEEEKAARQAVLEEQRLKEEESRRQLEEEQELERQLAAKEASLPEEPAADDENALTLLVRMPDGSRRGRRFLRTNKLQSLFDFIDVGRAVKPGTYRVVRPYPRRAFSDGDSNVSLSELGLTSKQEALFLELI